MAANNTTTNPLDLSSIVLAGDISIFVIGVLSIFTNGTLLLITFLDPLKKFQRSSIYFITSLSLSDFITGMTCCLFAFRDKISLDPIFQNAIFASIWSSVQNSFITILLLSVERLLVVKNPLGVRSLITKRRTLLVIAIAWIVSLVSGAGTAIPLPYSYYVRFGLMLEFSVIVLAMLFIYVRMLLLLRKANKLFKGKKFNGNSRSQIPQGGRKAQHTLNIVVFYLAVILIFTVGPHLSLGLTVYSYLIFCQPGVCPITTAMYIALQFTFPFEMLHFVLNPIVYAWRLSEYRKSLAYYLVPRNNAYYPKSTSISSRNSMPSSITTRVHTIANPS